MNLHDIDPCCHIITICHPGDPQICEVYLKRVTLVVWPATQQIAVITLAEEF